MAYKVKSMVSPAMTRKFLLPSWQAWSDRIKKSGCQIFEVDSDGEVSPKNWTEVSPKNWTVPIGVF